MPYHETLARSRGAANVQPSQMMPYMPCRTSRTQLGPRRGGALDTASTDRIATHQATGMIAVQLDDTLANALARLRVSTTRQEKRPVSPEAH